MFSVKKVTGRKGSSIMKTDLAPKYYYYTSLLIGVGAWSGISLIHATSSMAAILESGNYTSFYFTTVSWLIVSGYLYFHINNVRYVVIIPEKESEFIYGNIFFKARGSVENLGLIKRIWYDIFCLQIDGKKYYVISDKTLIEKYFNL